MAKVCATLKKKREGGDKKSLSPISESDQSIPSAASQKKKVAKEGHISVKQLERAAALRNKDPKLAAEVEAGTKEMVQAEKELQQPQQQKPVAFDVEGVGKDKTVDRAAEQAPSDEAFKLTDLDVEDLGSACDDAISFWQQHKKDNYRGYVAGKDEDEDDEIAGIEERIKTYEVLKAQLARLLRVTQKQDKFCRRCRKLVPLFIYDANNYYCEVCIK
jgi:hypothetical protein